MKPIPTTMKWLLFLIWSCLACAKPAPADPQAALADETWLHP